MRTWMVLVASLVACGTSAQVGGPDAATDGGAEATTAEGGACCTPDPTPGCCMHYGGWADQSWECAAVCDGMPQPNDPGWVLTKDAHGCSVWTNPKPNGGPGTCGAATPIDAGTD